MSARIGEHEVKHHSIPCSCEHYLDIVMREAAPVGVGADLQLNLSASLRMARVAVRAN
jgi:hypothetical protein